MHVLRFLLDDALSPGSWGSSLRFLVSLLVMVIVGIGAIIWWLKRG
ncbi:MAG: hypothetical protein ABSH08_18960 [Tepidisphaeraceae bacterium]|jgi:hypothetical protein